MNYKIIINVPNEKTPTEVLITGEQMEILEKRLNLKQIIKIGDSFFNTAYIVKIIPDVEANLIEAPKYFAIEEQADITKNENAQREMEKLRKKFNFRKQNV